MTEDLFWHLIRHDFDYVAEIPVLRDIWWNIHKYHHKQKNVLGVNEEALQERIDKHLVLDYAFNRNLYHQYEKTGCKKKRNEIVARIYDRAVVDTRAA